MEQLHPILSFVLFILSMSVLVIINRALRLKYPMAAVTAFLYGFIVLHIEAFIMSFTSTPVITPYPLRTLTEFLAPFVFGFFCVCLDCFVLHLMNKKRARS